MERVKVAISAVIAVALVKIALSGGGELGVAHAAGTGTVSCEAFLQNPGLAGGLDKALAKSKEWFGPVKLWLEAHPGSTIFATELYGGVVYVICVREG
jgi:hypothetical protein